MNIIIFSRVTNMRLVKVLKYLYAIFFGYIRNDERLEPNKRSPSK